jgi:hypothetical protein
MIYHKNIASVKIERIKLDSVSGLMTSWLMLAMWVKSFYQEFLFSKFLLLTKFRKIKPFKNFLM